MIPENRIPTHPGVILSQEFLGPLGVSQVAFAGHLGVPVQRINELIRGKRGVTPETAWLLAQALDTLSELMTTAESESVRRAAASEWLANCLTIRQETELEKRLTELEKAAKL